MWLKPFSQLVLWDYNCLVNGYLKFISINNKLQIIVFNIKISIYSFSELFLVLPLMSIYWIWYLSSHNKYITHFCVDLGLILLS